MRRPRDRKRRSKAGVTLVEVMLAGAMTALVVLATLEGFIVAAKIAHENAEALRADGAAFDILWQNFYRDYDQLTSAALTNEFDDVTSIGGNCKKLTVDLPYGANNQYTRQLEVYRSDIPRISSN